MKDWTESLDEADLAALIPASALAVIDNPDKAAARIQREMEQKGLLVAAGTRVAHKKKATTKATKKYSKKKVARLRRKTIKPSSVLSIAG